MKSICQFSMVILVSLFTFSCTSKVILLTNFQNEVLGTTPSHDIPGNPPGDRIDFIPELAPGLKIGQWNTTGTKALEFSYVNTGRISGHSTWLSFRGASTDFSQTVWYIYSAKRNANFGDLITDLSDGSSGYIARMKIKPSGHVTLIGRDWFTEREIGRVPIDAPFSVIFTVNVASGTYNLMIASVGKELIRVNNEPLMTSNPLSFHNPANPSISFSFDQGAGPGTKYTIERLSITHKNPSKK
jgi:hypothetical protein